MPDPCCPGQLVAEGSRTSKRQPRPWLATSITPRCASTMPRSDGQPVPAAVVGPVVRAVLPRKAVSKTRGRSSAGMPPHASDTVKETASTGSLLTRAVTAMVPSFGVWRIALSSRLRSDPAELVRVNGDWQIGRGLGDQPDALRARDWVGTGQGCLDEVVGSHSLEPKLHRSFYPGQLEQVVDHLRDAVDLNS